jgi:hypothetical protein
MSDPLAHEPHAQLIGSTFSPDVPPQRLPSPYRPELDAAREALASIEGELDWPRVTATATPWIQAVREDPAPFWALESLLAEYPISSDEGLALMRLAEALLRVPDRDTAIALTADQLGARNTGEADRASGSKRPPGRTCSATRCLAGRLLAPCIYEIDRVEAADEEIFGPVLQVARWSESETEAKCIHALDQRIDVARTARLPLGERRAGELDRSPW